MLGPHSARPAAVIVRRLLINRPPACPSGAAGFHGYRRRRECDPGAAPGRADWGRRLKPCSRVLLPTCLVSCVPRGSGLSSPVRPALWARLRWSYSWRGPDQQKSHWGGGTVPSGGLACSRGEECEAFGCREGTADRGGVSSPLVGRIQKGAGGTLGIWRLGIVSFQSRECWRWGQGWRGGGTGQDDGVQPQSPCRIPCGPAGRLVRLSPLSFLAVIVKQ